MCARAGLGMPSLKNPEDLSDGIEVLTRTIAKDNSELISVHN